MHDSWPREPQGRELENLTQLFKVLGDPSRMKVLFQIGSSEACVTEVAARLAEGNPDANWLIMNGNRLQIKRKQFEKVIDELEVI